MPDDAPLAGAAVRSMVVWCHDWPVAAVGCRPDEPAAVVFANRVVARTPVARRAGVQVGQRRREAQGRCPDLVVHERDESREARAFEPILQAIEVFTPRLELTRPGTCTFATRGPSRYFGGDAALADLVHAQVDAVLAERGWAHAVGIGVADGPFAAALAAQRARRAGGTAPILVVPPGASPAFLAPESIHLLDRPELTDVVARLGLTTLGAFAELDPADVVARFGPDGVTAHRLAAGRDERPPNATEPPPDLTVTAELDPPAERVDAAAFLAKTMADELFAKLDGRGLSCTRVLIAAETEHGESIERLWRHEGALTPGAITDRVRWQLDGWLNAPADRGRPTAGISVLRLVPDEVVPAHGRQLGFWGGETEGDRRAVRAVARLQGLLGADAVLVPEQKGGRAPGEQLRLVPATTVDLDGDRPTVRPDWVRAPWPGRIPAPAPALICDPPIPVDVVDADGHPVEVNGRGDLSAPPARLLFDCPSPSIRRRIDGDGPSPSNRRRIDGGDARRPFPSNRRRIDGYGRVDALVDASAGFVEPVVETPVGGAVVAAWAGPWPADERWWDPAAHRRRARFQVVTDDGIARLVTLEGGRWWIEAVYD